jgi:hypothetical protein
LEKDGLDMFVGVEDVDSGEKGGMLDGGEALLPGRRQVCGGGGDRRCRRRMRAGHVL